jgi:hypothetical protein
MLRFHDTARYVDQGGGKRKGSFAIYIETCMRISLNSWTEKEYCKKKCARVFFANVDFGLVH